jgi:hypothetical protein
MSRLMFHWRGRTNAELPSTPAIGDHRFPSGVRKSPSTQPLDSCLRQP